MFYSTKPHGVGIGLAICRSRAAKYQGQVVADPARAGGAKFLLRLFRLGNVS